MFLKSLYTSKYKSICYCTYISMYIVWYKKRQTLNLKFAFCAGNSRCCSSVGRSALQKAPRVNLNCLCLLSCIFSSLLFAYFFKHCLQSIALFFLYLRYLFFSVIFLELLVYFALRLHFSFRYCMCVWNAGVAHELYLHLSNLLHILKVGFRTVVRKRFWFARNLDSYYGKY